jgi:Tfp pilus assembly protein FimT
MAELMVCLAVVLILACLALPGLSSLMGRSTLAIEADSMRAGLCRARDLAMRQQVYWRVCFEPDGSRWYCFADPDRDSERDAGEALLGPYVLGRGVTFGSRAAKGPNNSDMPADGVSLAGNRLSFSPMGSSNAGTIYLRSRDKDMALRIMPASGTVLLYEWGRSWGRVE